MQVLEICGDPDRYQDVSCVELRQSGQWNPEWNFDGTPRMDSWVPLNFVIRRPSKKKSSLLTWAGNVFVLPMLLLNDEMLGPIYRASGELLPAMLCEQEVRLLNVMPMSECLDEVGSVWEYWQGKRGRLLKPCFVSDQVPLGRIFKIPPGPAQLLTAHFPGENRPDDFKAIYDKRKYKGLRFRLLWDSDDAHASVVEF